MTTKDAQAPLAWVATDSNGHQHRISSKWVFTTFSTKETNLSYLVHLLRYTLFYFRGQSTAAIGHHPDGNTRNTTVDTNILQHTWRTA